ENVLQTISHLERCKLRGTELQIELALGAIMTTQGNGSNGNGHAHVDASVSAESEGGASLFHIAPPPGELTKKDFVSNQEVRWCPGCGDYAILNNVQKVMPELGIPREKMVFVSGIGCSSRFPYYMNTYGFHS